MTLVGIPLSFQTLLSDPAPGLVFSANEQAGLGRRAYPAPHIVADPAGWSARRTLRLLAKPSGPLEDVHAFFGAHDGLSLCVCEDRTNRGPSRAALSFLPVAAWDAATITAEGNDDGRLFAGLDEIYRHDSYRVIASSPSESTLLTLLLADGDHPQAKAGSIFYLSMRPVCERIFPLATSLGELLAKIAANPAGFVHSLGFTGRVAGMDGRIYDDLIESYVPDVRQQADLYRAAA